MWRHELLLHMDTVTAGHQKETHDRPAAECCSENYVPRLIVTNCGWDPCRWRKSLTREETPCLIGCNFPAEAIVTEVPLAVGPTQQTRPNVCVLTSKRNVLTHFSWDPKCKICEIRKQRKPAAKKWLTLTTHSGALCPSDQWNCKKEQFAE